MNLFILLLTIYLAGYILSAVIIYTDILYLWIDGIEENSFESRKDVILFSFLSWLVVFCAISTYLKRKSKKIPKPKILEKIENYLTEDLRQKRK